MEELHADVTFSAVFDGIKMTIVVDLIKIGHDRYQLKSIPYGIDELNYGDQVSGKLDGHRFDMKEIGVRGGWKTEYYSMPDEERGLENVVSACNQVDKMGGIWGWHCGLLVFTLPPGKIFADVKWDTERRPTSI